MNGPLSAAVGGVLAVVTAFVLVGIVSSGTPAPVDSPYIVYGQS